MSINQIRNSLLLPQAQPRANFKEVLDRLGLAGGLMQCFDVGDAGCYSGSGQNVNDLSGNAENYYLGYANTADANDPAFVGTAGNLSDGTYLSFAGDEVIELQTHTISTWMNNIHKDNAIFSLVVWCTNPSYAFQNFRASTVDDTHPAGLMWGQNGSGSGGQLFLNIAHDTGNALLNNSGISVPTSGWAMLGASVNEATGASGGVHFMNGQSATFTSTYTTPSTNSATPLRWGSYHNQVTAVGGASGLTGFGACFAGWNVALTLGQFMAIFNATRGRFQI